MSRAVKKAAGNQLNTTNALGAGYNANAGSLYSSLEPQLSQMALNPQGFSPTDEAAMKTGAAQSLGGSTSGITGEGNLLAARRRNAAGYADALDKASRTSGQELSQADLGVTEQNARLKQQQQQFALNSLGRLYGNQVSAGEGYYGMAPSELKVEEEASPGWMQSLGGFLADLGKAGQGAGEGYNAYENA